MKKLLAVSCVLLVIDKCVAPPPHRTEQKEHHESKEKGSEEPSGLEGLGIEYERYLREVIDVLESDPEFKKKLEAAEETDIRSGKIAHELEYVDHNVRSKLDEVKRAELERLRHYAQREYELTNGIDVDHMKIQPAEHLDHGNPHTFEISDLKKLIHKVTNDLSEADKKRRQEFKEYEMQKEFEKEEHLKQLEGAEKEAFEKQLKDNETKHKQHDPLHHPGSKAQLEEVWEKQDHMKDQEFDPKVFFRLHDLDGNGYWDENEVKVLFIKELDKMYQAGAPEDDLWERREEMERMREHVFKEADKNGDQLISYDEFLNQTKQPEFEKDPQWETIDQQQPVYTHEEYLEFERRRQQEIQRMIQQGLIPPQPQFHNVPPGYHHPEQQFHQAGQHQQPPHNQQGYPQQAHHPQQFQQAHPPQYQQAHPQQFQQQPPVYQPHPGQQQQYQPNQAPPHYDPNAIHPNQYPQQPHPNAPPQGTHHDVPSNNMGHQNYPNPQNQPSHLSQEQNQANAHPPQPVQQNNPGIASHQAGNAAPPQPGVNAHVPPPQSGGNPHVAPPQSGGNPHVAPPQSGGNLHGNNVPQPAAGVNAKPFAGNAPQYPNAQAQQNTQNLNPNSIGGSQKKV